jgi:cytoskeletal protein RodZ
MSNSTQIPIEMLENIEAEEFDKIPDAGYLRWYVTTYVRILSLPNPREVADQYMILYRQWLKKQE